MKRAVIFILTFTASFFLARAADYNLPVIANRAPDTAGPAGWVSNLYQFSLMGAGLLAFGVIVYAGFMYALRAGNPSAQSDARDRITQALLGLLLLLGAYIILRTINPALVNLPTELGLEKVQAPATPNATNNKPAPTPCDNKVTYYQCPGGNGTNWVESAKSSCDIACGKACVATSRACP